MEIETNSYTKPNLVPLKGFAIPQRREATRNYNFV